MKVEEFAELRNCAIRFTGKVVVPLVCGVPDLRGLDVVTVESHYRAGANEPIYTVVTVTMGKGGDASETV